MLLCMWLELTGIDQNIIRSSSRRSKSGACGGVDAKYYDNEITDIRDDIRLKKQEVREGRAKRKSKCSN